MIDDPVKHLPSSFQNIEELRAGIGTAKCQISKNQTMHNDVHQLLKTDFISSLTWALCRGIPITYILNLNY